VADNVLWTTRGTGLYVEGGNEVNNTFRGNAIVCEAATECMSEARESGIYAIGMANHFIGEAHVPHCVASFKKRSSVDT